MTKVDPELRSVNREIRSVTREMRSVNIEIRNARKNILSLYQFMPLFNMDIYF